MRTAVASRILNVCLYCENLIVGVAETETRRSDEGRVCKVHLAAVLAPQAPGTVRIMPAVMHPSGWCDHGGQCHTLPVDGLA